METTANVEVTPSVDLGRWMGRHDAFGLIAGRCTAADIESLRRIRDGKLYTPLKCTWEEFCVRHIGVSRRTVDTDIQYLREWGPAFFTIRQLTHVRVRDYESVAPAIKEDALTVDGEVIKLLPENSEPLTAGVMKLVQRHRESKAAAPFDTLLKRCRATTKALAAFEQTLDNEQKLALASEVAQLCSAGEALATAA